MKPTLIALVTRRPVEAAFSYPKERKLQMLTGWKTLILNGAVIVVTALLQWMAGIDWVQYVGPEWAVILVAAVNFVNRFWTSTPWGKSA